MQISHLPKGSLFLRQPRVHSKHFQWRRCRQINTLSIQNWDCERQNLQPHSFHGQASAGALRRPQRSKSCSGIRVMNSAAHATSISSERVPPISHAAVQSAADAPPPGGRAFFDWLADLPWQRLGVWGVVVVFAYQLRDFFGIAMGTFVLSFIGNSFVEGTHRLPTLPPFRSLSEKWQRRSLVLLFYAIIVCTVGIFGLMTIPEVIREGADFVSRLQNDNIWVVVLEKLRHGLGDGVMDALERFLLVAAGDERVGSLGNSPEVTAWTAERTMYLGAVLQKMLKGYTEAAVGFTTGLLTLVSRFAVQVGVSLILSFMVVWDLPRIGRGVRSLETSRLSAVYAEVAPSVSIFGELFGRALQAQARIAAVNTALTALGMWALQLPGLGLLSMFVFLCSFIPIAGVAISTAPIGFVALTEYGFFKLGLVLGMVTGIHFVEAYLLNPAIYAAHLQLHPLLVLSVLVVAEHSLGVWGLLLAVPLTVFCLDYCIRYPACSIQEIAASQLKTVQSSTDSDMWPKDEQLFKMPQGVTKDSVRALDA